MPAALMSRLAADPGAKAELQGMLDSEAFGRYDTNGDGWIDEAECLAMGLTLLVLIDGFAAAVAADIAAVGGSTADAAATGVTAT